MIALLFAAQLLVIPPVQTDTAAISAMGATSLDTVRTTTHIRSDPTHPTNCLSAQERDAWLGPDKFKHAAMSYAITAYTFAATDSEPAAVASAAIAGILKEIYDRKRGYAFSLRDLVWDAAGVALGYAVVKQTR